MGLELLENKGFYFLNTDNLKKEKRQIIVSGSARGGTSLVAGTLHHLGIFTGEKSSQPVFEDVLISEAFETNNIDLAKEIVSRYCNNYDLWAWKRPAALNYLNKIDEIVPNPFYIFIFKDIFAIANRNNISMKSDVVGGLNNALNDYKKIVDFISSTNKPIMLVSAEKALQNKQDFVNALVEMNKDFLGDNIDTNQAISFIEPNPKLYLDSSRITKAKGRVDEIKNNQIFGYAMYVHNKNKSAEVELYLNDKLYLKTTANQIREDIFKAGIHPTGMCGFCIPVDNEIIKKENLIKIKVQDDVIEIENGLFYFQDVVTA